MENWRKRWEQLTEDVAIEGYLPNGQMASDFDIEDFISEELDKAREEGYKKAIRDVRGAIKNSKFDKNGKRIVSTVEVLVAPILDKLKE